MNDDEFNTLCEAHSFGAVARGEFPLMPRGLLKALVDAALAAERQRLLNAAEETKWAMYSGEGTFADALREIMGPNVRAKLPAEAGGAWPRKG